MTHMPDTTLGPFDAVRELHYDAAFPMMLPVRLHFPAAEIDDIAAETFRALDPLRSTIRPGATVALTAGSRGIRDIAAVTRAAGEWLRAVGAEPFVVPAMGSHGGATADGQRELLRGLHMTEETLGMPVRATMETIELGRLEEGPQVHLDAYAAQADWILPINRVKAHTDFKSDIESGLAKILAVGLGKHRGAAELHRFGPSNLGTWIPEAARRIVGTGKVLGGLAILENAYDRTARISLLAAEDIGGPAEAALLREAKDVMARLPFEDLDVAIIDVMGKNISGAGMDTNVIGRMMIRDSPEFDGPRIRNIVVLDLSDESHGNAVGMGLADFMPFRVIEKLDLRSVYINAMTAGLGGPQRAQVPIALPTDRSAIAAALLTCGRADLAAARLIRMRSTLDLENLLVSVSLTTQVEADERLSIVGEPEPLRFDEAGRLLPW